MKFTKLNFATAGIPLSTEKPSTENGIKRVHELKLDGMELEFVHSVNVSKQKAPEIKKIAEQENIMLTAHGSYYINLNAKEKEKITASKKRILEAAKILNACGGFSLTFHAGFNLGMEKKEVYENIKSQLNELINAMNELKLNIRLSPETTGKKTQFGSLEELISLSEEIPEINPCIDFSHLHARSNGKMNSFNEFCGVLELMEKELGKKSLNEMHIHCSGINYGEKGEKNHLILKESDFKYKELLKALKEFNCKGQLVNESPNIEIDAMLLKKEFEKI
ncbi:MAG: TIM barrel protein [Candidatus Diapherotrites archaeon]